MPWFRKSRARSRDLASELAVSCIRWYRRLDMRPSRMSCSRICLRSVVSDNAKSRTDSSSWRARPGSAPSACCESCVARCTTLVRRSRFLAMRSFRACVGETALLVEARLGGPSWGLLARWDDRSRRSCSWSRARSRASARSWRAASSSSRAFCLRRSSRRSFSSCWARAPAARAWDTSPLLVASAACCIRSRAWSSRCWALDWAPRSWFSGRCIRCWSSSASARFWRCSSWSRLSSRRSSSWSLSLAAWSAVCSSLRRWFISSCRWASSLSRLRICDCSRRSASWGDCACRAFS